MPTYNYQCPECDHEFEERHSIKTRRKICPECQKPGLVRLIGPGGGIIFKGSGFYETDYKKPAKPPDSG